MIIIKLKGGLGNQMFQYACGRHLAEKNNDVLMLDIDWYRPDGIPAGDTIRHYGLDQFAISAKVADEKDIEQVGGRPSFMRRLARKIAKKIKPINSYIFDPKVLKQKGHLYLEGFFQSEQYFKDIEFIIRNEFQLRNVMGAAAHAVLQDIEQSNAVAIHVRRGDYADNKHTNAFHGICSPEYYHAAIELISQKIDSPAFFVFSDDIAWAKENIKIPVPVTYVSNEDIADHEELILMSKCKHNIIANSSFSWWGAWLNQNPNKIVIAPKQWLADPVASQNDIVPESWIQV